MEVNVSIFMAIADFFPVVIFMVGMGYIIKLANHRISPVRFAMLTGGVFIGFLAGLAKCLWKLLYALGIDFVPLNTSFVIYQTAGFLLIAIGICSLCSNVLRGKIFRKEAVPVSSTALPLAAGIAVRVIEKPSFVFFIFMGLFTSVYLIALAIICFKKKKWWGILYILSMLLMFAMVGLSSQFDAGGSFERLNWVAEVINCLTQACMAVPSILLYKSIGSVKTSFEEVEL